MIRVKCVNPECPKKSFDWDETRSIQRGGRIAQPYETGAVRVIATCPFCTTENTVWVRDADEKDDVIRRH